MKKIISALAASLFALTLYAGHATACPAHDHNKATADKAKKDSDKALTDTKKKDTKKTDDAKKKAPAKPKVS